jgi:hypothetical protein
MYGIKEIPFCDTEFEVDGLKQIWGGEFHVDENGAVVGISREWLGTGQTRIHYDIPHRFRAPETLVGKAALTLAKVLEKDCKSEIEDAVNEFAVAEAERSWSPRSEWGTQRAVRGRVAG